jgi:hypothetical protein
MVVYAPQAFSLALPGPHLALSLRERGNKCESKSRSIPPVAPPDSRDTVFHQCVTDMMRGRRDARGRLGRGAVTKIVDRCQDVVKMAGAAGGVFRL